MMEDKQMECPSRRRRCPSTQPPSGVLTRNVVDEKDVKEWDEVRCPICMEHPHNAVVLLCASSERGCRVFMCDTSYRHSNCFDQFQKASLESASLQLQYCRAMTCPLCRGAVLGWTVDAAARGYMNSKIRGCSTESCGFIGSYEDLRRHARLEHPCARPTEADPERQRDWSRMEQESDLGDLLSNLRPAFSVHGEDLSRDGSGLLSRDLSFAADHDSPFTLYVDNIVYEMGDATQLHADVRTAQRPLTRVSESITETRLPLEGMDSDNAGFPDEFTIVADGGVSINIDMYCEDAYMPRHGASSSRSRRNQRRLRPWDVVLNNDDTSLTSGINVFVDGLGIGVNVPNRENPSMPVHRNSRRLGRNGQSSILLDAIISADPFTSEDDVGLYMDTLTRENEGMPSIRRSSTRGLGRRRRRWDPLEGRDGEDGVSFAGITIVGDACLELDIGMWDHDEPIFPPQVRQERRTHRRVWQVDED